MPSDSRVLDYNPAVRFALLPGSRHIVTAGFDQPRGAPHSPVQRAIKVFDAESAVILHTFHSHDAIGPSAPNMFYLMPKCVLFVSVLGDGIVATGDEDGVLCVWRVPSGEVLHRHTASDGAIFSSLSAVNDAAFVAGTMDGSVVYREHDRGTVSPANVAGVRAGVHGRHVGVIAVGGGLIATASCYERDACVFDAGSGAKLKELARLQAQRGTVHSVVVSESHVIMMTDNITTDGGLRSGSFIQIWSIGRGADGAKAFKFVGIAEMNFNVYLHSFPVLLSGRYLLTTCYDGSNPKNSQKGSLRLVDWENILDSSEEQKPRKLDSKAINRTRFPFQVNHVAVTSDGGIYVCGDRGVFFFMSQWFGKYIRDRFDHFDLPHPSALKKVTAPSVQETHSCSSVIDLDVDSVGNDEDKNVLPASHFNDAMPVGDQPRKSVQSKPVNIENDADSEVREVEATATTTVKKERSAKDEIQACDLKGEVNPCLGLPDFDKMKSSGVSAGTLEPLDREAIADFVAAFLVGFRRMEATYFFAARKSLLSALHKGGVFGGDLLCGKDAVISGDRFVELALEELTKDGLVNEGTTTRLKSFVSRLRKND